MISEIFTPSDFFQTWRKEVLLSGKVAPVKFGMSQEDLLRLFGSPTAISNTKKGKPIIWKYDDIEFFFNHFNQRGLVTIYSEDGEGKVRLCLQKEKA